MRRDIELPTDVVEALSRVNTDDPDILGHDPGSGSTGLALLSGNQIVFSTQGRPADVCREYAMMMGNEKRVDIFVREQPYSRSQGEKQVHGGTGNAYVLGFAAGWVSCALRGVIKDAEFWEPLPSTARAVFNLNRKKTAERSARELTNEAVWEWATRITGLPLVGPGGGRRYDEANSIVLCYAARSVVRGIRAKQSGKVVTRGGQQRLDLETRRG